MGVKLTEWRLRMSDNILSVLSRADKAFDNTKGKAKNLQNTLSGEKFQNFAGEIPALSRGVALLSSGYMLAGAGIAATGALMYKGVDAALDYETAMAKVNATAQLSPEKLALLKDELVKIGEESAGNFNRIPDAFERINSQVNNVSKSLDILKVANKGAQAGFVDIDLAAGALAQTLSITGNRDTASGIMDMMLKAKAVGAGEFKDFAQYLPQLIASGDNLSVGHKDVAGLFAFMTAKGQNAADAAMLMQNAFTAMGKSEIQKGLAQSGISLFDKQGNIRDLGQFFSELNAKTARLTAQGKSNFLESIGLRDAQAKNAFSVLAGDAEKLRDILGEVRNNTGELNEQLDKTANKARNWSEIGDKLKSWTVQLGEAILPIVDRMVSSLDNWIKYFGGKTEWQKLDVLKKDDELAQDYAKNKVLEKYPMFGPAMFENKGANLEGKAAEIYRYSYNWDMAKLTGTMFGGDYDKFLAEQRALKTGGEKPEKTGFDLKGKKKKNSALQEGIESVNEGGRSVRYINVSFKNMVDTIQIQPQTLKEGTNEVVKDLEEMLVRAVSGAEESLINE